MTEYLKKHKVILIILVLIIGVYLASFTLYRSMTSFHIVYEVSLLDYPEYDEATRYEVHAYIDGEKVYEISPRIAGQQDAIPSSRIIYEDNWINTESVTPVSSPFLIMDIELYGVHTEASSFMGYIHLVIPFDEVVTEGNYPN
jgi:hypothetical protein